MAKKELKLNYSTFATKHSRDYYRGQSFHFSGEWLVGAHYLSDDYIVDFVVHDQVLLACAKSHLSILDNEPKDFIRDESGTVVGVVSTYWDFVLSGIVGKSPGIKIVDNYWYTCANIDVPEDEQVWINTGVKAKLELNDLSSEEIELLQKPGKEVVTEFVSNTLTQELGNNTDKIISQKGVTDTLNSKASTSQLSAAITNEVLRANEAYQSKGDYATNTRVNELESTITNLEEDVDSNIDGINNIISDIQSDITTIEGNIPTKVSQLENDSKYQTKTNLDNALSSIKDVVPQEATALNKLADKNFVLTSINAACDGKSDKSTTVTNVTYDSTTKKLTKTINNSTTDVISIATIKSDLNLEKSDVGLSNVDNTSDLSKPISTLTQTALDNKVDKISGKGLSTNDYTTAEKQKLATGVAELDETGHVISSQLPSYVDDVSEYTSMSYFPETGESGKIYVDITTNLTYRWTGSAYTEISPSIALGETSSTAYRGDRGKTAYNHAIDSNKSNTAQSLGLYKISTTSEGHISSVDPATKSDIGLGNVDNTSDANKPISTATQTALNNKVDKIAGKQLSTEDYTSVEKNKLEDVESNAQVNIIESIKVDNNELPINDKTVNIDLSSKVDVAQYETNSDDFIFRPTGGGLEINAKTAQITEVRGKSLVWNQLANLSSGSVNNQGITYSYANGRIMASGTSTGISAYSFLPMRLTVVSGHKYFLFFRGTYSGITVRPNFGQTGNSLNSSVIITASGTACSVLLQPTETNITVTADFYLYIIDLTLMFGAGNEPATVAEFEALFPLPYYAYNAWTIINNKAEEIQTVGFNQWDEEWESGHYNNGVKINSNTRIRCKNPITCFPSTAYKETAIGEKSNTTFEIHFLDATGNYISRSYVTNGTFTTPDNCYYFVFCSTTDYYGSTYNHDICINLSDQSRNGQYEPYKKSTLSLNISTLTGKLNGEGESVIICSDGLKSAGSVYDYGIIENGYLTKIVKVIGEVDLGTLDWTYSNDYTWMVSNAISGIKSISNTDTTTVLVAKNYTKYEFADLTSNALNGLAQNSANKIIIRDSAYTDAATFKAAMNGVMLNYELATPQTYVLDEPIYMGYQVDKLGTETVLPDNTSSVLTTPFVASIDYYETNIKDIEVEGMTKTVSDINSKINTIKSDFNSIVIIGNTTPDIIPKKAGQFFIDTINKVLYFAIGNTSIEDWVQI